MSRPRNFQSGFPYHIVSRGNQREDIFKEIRDYKYFTKLLMKYSSVHDIAIFSYCLMPNHYHLLVCSIDTASISKFMHIVNCAYAEHMKRKYGWVGHVFQSRFRAYKIGDFVYFETILRYIKRNPVKAGLALKIGEYKWQYTNSKLVRKMSQVYKLMS